MRKSSLRLANSRELHTTCLFYWFLNYEHNHCNIQVMLFMHRSEFDIFKMASRWKPTRFTNQCEQHPTCGHVWWICNRPDTLPDRAALYELAYLNKWTQHACLIELHCTSRHIREWHLISRHVWYNGTAVQVAPTHPSSICTRLVKCWMQRQLISRHNL